MDRDEKYVNRWVWEKKRNGTGVRKRVLKGATKQYFLLSTRKEVVNLSMNGNLIFFFIIHGRIMVDLKGAPSLQVRIQRDKNLMRGKRSTQTQRKQPKTICRQQQSLAVKQIQTWLSSMQRRVAMNKLPLRCSQWLWTKICWKNRHNSSRQILMLVGGQLFAVFNEVFPLKKFVGKSP